MHIFKALSSSLIAVLGVACIYLIGHAANANDDKWPEIFMEQAKIQGCYDVHYSMDSKTMRHDMTYRIRSKYPSGDIIAFYTEILGTDNFRFFVPKFVYEKGMRKWKTYIDGTREGNPRIYSWRNYWINRDKTRVIMVNLKYISKFTAARRIPDNEEMIVIISVSPYALYESFPDETLLFEYISPPLAVNVVNEEGKKLGNDFAVTIGKHEKGPEIREIERSDISTQDVNEDNDLGVKEKTGTLWRLRIFDPGIAKFKLHIRGLEEGVGEVYVESSELAAGFLRQYGKDSLSLLVMPGSSRSFNVSVNGEKKLLIIQKESSPDNLRESIEIACHLGLVNVPSICVNLQAMANNVAALISDKKKEAAKSTINRLISEMESQARDHVKEPAMTIIREEAESLLNSL